jgi:hypothetical protein
MYQENGSVFATNYLVVQQHFSGIGSLTDEGVEVT